MTKNNIRIAFILTLCCNFVFGAPVFLHPDSILAIIPTPTTVQYGSGSFRITPNTKIITREKNKDVEAIAKFLSDEIYNASGSRLQIQKKQHSKKLQSTFSLELRPELKNLGDEGYRLVVNNSSVVLSAQKPAGLFWGIQTIRQMLPMNTVNNSVSLPSVTIEDIPRFPWRGLMLDCCRHFLSKDFIKRYIDLLARYKMNTLHWHLTEDQGWRMEIKKYPKLTEIGAWRTEEDGSVYGGYYTQEDMKEVVAYAKQRYINVVPELELPGHSTAALAAYPQFSCAGGPFKVETRWGIFPDVYCAGNDSTFIFLENILSEMIEIFPSAVFHIGGDECPKERWKNCPKCQARIKSEGLKDEHELQSYFIKRIAKFLSSKNKRIVGWDEILEGGLASDAIVQSWRSMDGAAQAVALGNQAIASPSNFTYFNSDEKTLNLKKVYSFDPVPSGLTEAEQKNILGGEACLWTEFAEQSNVDAKIFPRLLAMAERLWSSAERKDFFEFYDRVRSQYPRLDYDSVKYTINEQPVSILPVFDSLSRKLTLQLENWEREMQIRYTLDGSEPTHHSLLYQQPFIFQHTATIKAAAFNATTPYGKVSEDKFYIHDALGKVVHYTFLYSPKYSANQRFGLVDGIRGTQNFFDGKWQGFLKQDVEITIDLGKVIPLHSLAVGFLENIGSYIFLPTSVEFEISLNDTTYTPVMKKEFPVPTQERKPQIENVRATVNTQSGRFIRMKAKNLGLSPDWQAELKEPLWIFIDEILVNESNDI